MQGMDICYADHQKTWYDARLSIFLFLRTDSLLCSCTIPRYSRAVSGVKPTVAIPAAKKEATEGQEMSALLDPEVAAGGAKKKRKKPPSWVERNKRQGAKNKLKKKRRLVTESEDGMLADAAGEAPPTKKLMGSTEELQQTAATAKGKRRAKKLK